jgi:Transposase C of IS166 homeodomain
LRRRDGVCTIRAVIELSSLPPEVRALIEAQAATIARQDAELLVQRDTIAKMRLQLDRLRRMQFGRSSEKIAAEIAQLTLALEELEANPETHIDKAAEQRLRLLQKTSTRSPRADRSRTTYRASMSSTNLPARARIAAALCAGSART